MTLDGRLNNLERRFGGEDGQPPAAIVRYDLASAPKDPVERDAWLEAQRPVGAGAVFYVPDNGRSA
ncbi:MAG: hypothetical protein M3Q37_00710 [Gemmatimonadota bacterium]|nr:hypothetical protein [Gemmatimonadota bacterium]